ncbi:MAG: hypothetical protein SFY96_12545 [Planctomycetota bacterium]|nr:hypothetical protein [Planctomycetota bacterium]
MNTDRKMVVAVRLRTIVVFLVFCLALEGCSIRGDRVCVRSEDMNRQLPLSGAVVELRSAWIIGGWSHEKISSNAVGEAVIDTNLDDRAIIVVSFNDAEFAGRISRESIVRFDGKWFELPRVGVGDPDKIMVNISICNKKK